ncbi:hypothetical protein, partial [Bordetella bronchiseptica]|uniref:hypothetical protein n=1 Tax=Bordetella bronchiseptica TaxID=518 RepID=UPI0013A07DBC
MSLIRSARPCSTVVGRALLPRRAVVHAGHVVRHAHVHHREHLHRIERRHFGLHALARRQRGAR